MGKFVDDYDYDETAEPMVLDDPDETEEAETPIEIEETEEEKKARKRKERAELKKSADEWLARFSFKEKENSPNYVDNKKLYEAMCEFKKQCDENRERGLPRPEIPEFIGRSIILIATHLAYRPNFCGYSYREEMIATGVESCINYIENFDPRKSENPFSYFTQTCWYAFIRIIKLEKKQSILKGRLIKNTTYDENLEIDSDLNTQSVFRDYTNLMSTFVESAEEQDKKDEIDRAERAKINAERKEARRKKSPIEAYFVTKE